MSTTWLVRSGRSGAELAITAVSTLKSAAANGTTTLAVAPATAGNALLLATFNTGTPATTGVSGGGSTWTRVAPRTVNGNGDGAFELWLGKVSTTGSSTVTVAFNTSVGSEFVEFASQEFTAGLGATTVWAADGTAFRNNTSSTTIAYPTLVPTGAGRLYFGFALCFTGVSAGSTSGYSYSADVNGNQVAYNGSISASTSPTSSQSPAGLSAGTAVLVTAALPASGPPPRRITGMSMSVMRASYF